MIPCNFANHIPTLASEHPSACANPPLRYSEGLLPACLPDRTISGTISCIPSPFTHRFTAREVLAMTGRTETSAICFRYPFTLRVVPYITMLQKYTLRRTF